jgi:hypothetical protein
MLPICPNMVSNGSIRFYLILYYCSDFSESIVKYIKEAIITKKNIMFIMATEIPNPPSFGD